MPAFVNSLPVLSRRIEHKQNTEVTAVSSLRHSKIRLAAKRRQATQACAPPLNNDDSGAAKQEVLFDDMVSDDDYVVVDGKDVAKLVEELQRTGRDQIDTSGDDQVQEEGLSEDFLTLAEKRSDEWNGRAAAENVAKEDTEEKETTKSKAEQQVGMQYFQDDHVQFMPTWAAEAYRSGEHSDLEEAAMRITPLTGGQRLHDIVARKKVSGVGPLKDVQVSGDGIVDCMVQDVAKDYSVPVEFVVDAMLHYGVPVPIRPDQSIRDSMTTEEIEQLLKLITSFDAQDLADRYSDRTINELAENYDLSVERILDVCQKEALYTCSGERTRLSVVREDRLLDIILKDAALGQPYPALLQGLEA